MDLEFDEFTRRLTLENILSVHTISFLDLIGKNKEQIKIILQREDERLTDISLTYWLDYRLRNPESE